MRWKSQAERGARAHARAWSCPRPERLRSAGGRARGCRRWRGGSARSLPRMTWPAWATTASVGPAARRLRESRSIEKREPCQRFTGLSRCESRIARHSGGAPWKIELPIVCLRTMSATRFTHTRRECGAGERHDDSQNARRHARCRGVSRRGQSIPATNYTDLWDNSAVPGTGPAPEARAAGASRSRSTPATQVEAVWYTYDPRQPDSSSPGNFKPLWIVMPGGTWTSPTHVHGRHVRDAGHAVRAGVGSRRTTRCRSRRWARSRSTSRARRRHVPVQRGARRRPTSPTAAIPAFDLPSFSGTKPICRNSAF